MKHLLFILIAASLLFSTPASAQYTKYKKYSDKKFLSNLSVGVRASTLGVGVDLATPLNSRFVLRGGVDFAEYTSNSFNISLDDPSGNLEQAFGYVPDYRMKGKLNFVNGHVLVDFHPTIGIFHITGGFFVGTSKLKANGFIANPDTGEKAELRNLNEEWPDINFDEYQLKTTDGDLNAALQLGKVIKPYFGLGVGRAIANKRVAFKFELGVIYQGKYSLKQNGEDVSISESVDDIKNFEDIDTYTSLIKWWPMMNFQISYKIF